MGWPQCGLALVHDLLDPSRAQIREARRYPQGEKRSSSTSLPKNLNPLFSILFPSTPKPPLILAASHKPPAMANKEIVSFVESESHQDNPLSPMEQYFTEALQEEFLSVSAASLAMPRSTPRWRDPRGARGRLADGPTSPLGSRLLWWVPIA